MLLGPLYHAAATYLKSLFKTFRKYDRIQRISLQQLKWETRK